MMVLEPEICGTGTVASVRRYLKQPAAQLAHTPAPRQLATLKPSSVTCSGFTTSDTWRRPSQRPKTIDACWASLLSGCLACMPSDHSGSTHSTPCTHKGLHACPGLDVLGVCEAEQLNKAPPSSQDMPVLCVSLFTHVHALPMGV